MEAGRSTVSSAGNCLNEVGFADDPNQFAVPDHREGVNLAVGHDGGQFFQGGCFCYGNRVGGVDVAHFGAGHFLDLLIELVGAFQKDHAVQDRQNRGDMYLFVLVDQVVFGNYAE